MPNTLDHGSSPMPIEQALPLGVLQRAARIRHWVAEDARSTRAFLKRVNSVVPLAVVMQEQAIVELPRTPKGSQGARGATVAATTWRELLKPALAGFELGLISEAGLPAVADPGHALVAEAHRCGVAVEPLAGPSALVLAVAASGLGGQSFAFVGYLPQEAGPRTQRLRELEARAQREGQTQLFIETPYRNAALFEALLQVLQPTTRVGVACGVTLEGGWCRTLSVQQWRQTRPAFARDLPAVFSIGSA